MPRLTENGKKLIIQLKNRGRTNAEIAAILKCSITTVYKHVRYGKLNGSIDYEDT